MLYDDSLSLRHVLTNRTLYDSLNHSKVTVAVLMHRHASYIANRVDRSTLYSDRREQPIEL